MCVCVSDLRKVDEISWKVNIYICITFWLTAPRQGNLKDIVVVSWMTQTPQSC
jgi:hypothetical protein